ncbi:hypothetical protein [Leptospira sp. GIMC2001]|uniref:hypothetical protein n=1 Tax=Leptospira sp. GIMC2001 TaxID=1513297 RepID=UPI00234B9842|nr:hypothetical protein [Leptospira sp. GIMC2001]WCL50408.1 hypothetical protein O4O04_06200 [Leptospira sp. GIMC2001]
MNSISRTDAHKVFADLYRKSRPPEQQQLVDDAIQRSNDVFIRIDLIKKIDEDFQSQLRAKSALPEETPRPKRAEPKKDSGNRGTSASPKQNKPKNDDPKKKKKDAPVTGGFLSVLFGGNANIIKFAKDTEAVDIGLFGRNPTISGNVEKIFKYLKEDQIIATIQALRICEQQGWRIWNPLVYNVINNFNKFFNSFISLDSLFLDRISPEVFLDRSLKMQMYYTRLISRPDSKDIILDHVPEMVKQDEKLNAKLANILSGLNYGLALETTKPKLTEAIQAFYIVVHKKMMEWEDITKLLAVPPINETRFQASQEITKEVELTIARLSDEISTKLHKRDELVGLKNRYFKIDDKGKISFDFLGLVIEDYFSHHYPENVNTDGIKAQYKTMPHKLVYLLLRDFQSVFVSILEGYIKVGDKNQQNDVIAIQPGLFKSEIETINTIIRSIDAFNRKYPSFQYSFGQFSKDYSSGASDQIASNILGVLAEAADFFGKFAVKLNVIVENHLLAKQYEAEGTLQDKIHQTKEKVIEEIKILHRFIPHYDSRIVTRDRINGMMISDVFITMSKLLFNYAVIFKDKLTTSKLTQNRRLEDELQQLNKEYERLTGKGFEKSAKPENQLGAEDSSLDYDEN